MLKFPTRTNSSSCTFFFPTLFTALFIHFCAKVSLIINLGTRKPIRKLPQTNISSVLQRIPSTNNQQPPINSASRNPAITKPPPHSKSLSTFNQPLTGEKNSVSSLFTPVLPPAAQETSFDPSQSTFLQPKAKPPLPLEESLSRTNEPSTDEESSSSHITAAIS
ncbi:hypothetical protein KM043_010174 [Ampulex compressa]|nr:hypothetical protein KM043_010174 [Ampulex compressa]